MIQEERKKIGAICKKVGTARTYGGTVVPVSSTNKTAKCQREGTARACKGTAVRRDFGQKANFALHSTNYELSAPLSPIIYCCFSFLFFFKSLRTMLLPSV